MYKYILITSALVLIVFFLCGCSKNIAPVVKSYCVKCGNVATQTLSGSEEYMISNDIPISKCTHVASNIYTASICDSCLGPVATIKPSR